MSRKENLQGNEMEREQWFVILHLYIYIWAHKQVQENDKNINKNNKLPK